MFPRAVFLLLGVMVAAAEGPVTPVPVTAVTPLPAAAPPAPVPAAAAPTSATAPVTPLPALPGAVPALPGTAVTALPITAAPPPMTAQDVNAAAKGSVFRLSTRLDGANARTLHGTAFVVDVSGVLLTNFHVVREALLKGEELKLALEIGEQSVPASVLAVDVVNDLALVKAARTFERALPIAGTMTAAEGEVVYSLGFPANDQLTFIQGNYGGEKALGFVTAGFAAMPLNSGMSGGPMLNSRAEVIGVNRAIIRQAQNLSYFSPLGAVKELLSRGSGRSPASVATGWRGDAVSSIRRQEQSTLGSKFAPKRERIAGVSFEVPLPNQACGQMRTEKSGTGAEAEILLCQTNSLTPLVGNSNALDVRTFGAVTSGFAGKLASPIEKLVKIAYERERTEILDLAKGPHVRGKSMDERESCGLKNVENGHGVEMTVLYCSIANKFYEGLFSTFVRVEVRGKSREAILAQTYEGLSAETTAELLGQFLESIQTEEGT